jgi:hypothetical protein
LPVGEVISAASPCPTSMKSIRNVPAARAGRAGDNAVASSMAPATKMGRNRLFSVRTDGNDKDDKSEGDRSHFSLSAAVAAGRVGA